MPLLYGAGAHVHSVSKTRLFLAVGIATAGLVLIPASTAAATTTIDGPINLGSATSFAALGATKVTSATTSSISGDLGVSPQTSITGILPIDVTHGTIHDNDQPAVDAQAALTAAYLIAQSLSPQQSGMTELGGGPALTPGVYSGGALQLTGDLRLTGSATDVWVFQASSSLTTESGSNVILEGDASICNVFWQVDSSATLGSGSHFVGTLMAKQSISRSRWMTPRSLRRPVVPTRVGPP
jgi:Ice-binding-like